MAVVINSECRKEIIPHALRTLLPSRLVEEIARTNCRHIEEIRLRCDRAVSLTTDRGNVMLSTVIRRGEMDSLLCSVCDNSIYAHTSTIKNGYVTIDGGIRVGLCGKAAFDGDKMIGVHSVSSMNIRIPRRIRDVGDSVCDLYSKMGAERGILIYSPPGEGKTTLLRSVAAKLSSGRQPLRVAVIDTRGELSPTLDGEGLCLDILSGYPRGLGIEIATRTLNAQLIICDEIGDTKEADAIIAAQNCGVPFIASAHSSDVPSLLLRTGIRHLHRARVFGAYVGIKRMGAGSDFKYNITDWSEADAILQNSRGVSIDDRGNVGGIFSK